MSQVVKEDMSLRYNAEYCAPCIRAPICTSKGASPGPPSTHFHYETTPEQNTRIINAMRQQETDIICFELVLRVRDIGISTQPPLQKTIKLKWKTLSWLSFLENLEPMVCGPTRTHSRPVVGCQGKGARITATESVDVSVHTTRSGEKIYLRVSANPIKFQTPQGPTIVIGRLGAGYHFTMQQWDPSLFYVNTLELDSEYILRFDLFVPQSFRGVWNVGLTLCLVICRKCRCNDW